MRIGLVLSQPPSYSETFFNAKIKGLMDSGIEVTLFVQKNTNDYTTCEVMTAPKVYKNKVFQMLQSLLVLITLVPYLSNVRKFQMLEKQAGRPTKQRLKNLLTNAHLLKAKVDWLHFGFATLAINSEHVAKAIGTKMAVSLRGYDICIYPLKFPSCYKLVWPLVNKLHVISEDLLKLAHIHGLTSNNNAMKIPPAIDPAYFKSSDNMKKVDRVSFMSVARLHWKKGLVTTLEALAVLKKRGLHFKYQVIGLGLQYEELIFAIHQLNLENEVELVGKKTQEYILSQLQRTEIYLQFSISEGFCNAVLEAQAAGCLCIVSNAEGLNENILHEKTGWVVPKQQPDKLSQKIMEVINLPEHEKNYIRKNARDRVTNEFNLEQQTAKFLEFYE